jgi:hypothetical protein
MDVLETLVGQRDAAALDRIKFWDAGAAYRWARMAIDRISTLGFGVNPITKQPLGGLTLARNIALVMVAMYDATIAAWDSKYTYDRPRPNRFDHRLSTVIPDPTSPSYPSEHAAVGWAAATVLAYLYPQIGPAVQALAQDQGRSRLLAGVEFPSDVTAGIELGQAVGDALIERAKTDGADTPWTGTIPTVDPTGRGEPLWTGTNPIFPLAGTWETWVLTTGNQFRPGAYPDFFSPAGMADFDQVVTFDRSLNGANFNRNAEAFFAQTTVGVLGPSGASARFALGHPGALRLEQVSRPIVSVGPRRGIDLSIARFLGPHSRTGRASSPASGSPRAHACGLCGVPIVPRPRRWDVHAPIAIPGERDRGRVEQGHPIVGRAPPWQVAPSEPAPSRLKLLRPEKLSEKSLMG